MPGRRSSSGSASRPFITGVAVPAPLGSRLAGLAGAVARSSPSSPSPPFSSGAALVRSQRSTHRRTLPEPARPEPRRPHAPRSTSRSRKAAAASASTTPMWSVQGPDLPVRHARARRGQLGSGPDGGAGLAIEATKNPRRGGIVIELFHGRQPSGDADAQAGRGSARCRPAAPSRR